MFYLAAAYDGLVGAAFLVAPITVFNWYQVTPPNHMGYVQFPALIIILFAVMFVQIASQPIKNRNLIPYGIGLKVAYSGVVFKFWFTTGVPAMWKPFAIIDAVTAVLFVWAYIALGQGAE
jgi:hypothetical protein